MVSDLASLICSEQDAMSKTVIELYRERSRRSSRDMSEFESSFESAPGLINRYLHCLLCVACGYHLTTTFCGIFTPRTG